MKTQDMKHWRNVVIALVALLAVLFPMLGEADPLVGTHCTTRPLSDFLNAQGTLNNPPQFFPPVKDYVGWADGPLITFALVDYAGLANEYIKAQTGHSLGTKASGLVVECKLADHTAQITVALSTTRALGFAQSIQDLINNNFDFLNTPTIFGAKAQDVVDGADAAVGPVTLLTTFSISAPGAPLPDFLDVVNNTGNYAPVKLNFTSTAFGKCSNGRKALLHVHQVPSTNDQNALIFSIETVEVVDTDGGNCGG
jgi:hypothetical protein